jgi:gamma-glutamylcyclotransferase (GGCT)/AIG2-like uncharacterized protein YtfP
MSFRCPKATPVQAFELKDWELDFATHATIRPRKGSIVQGALWQLTVECEESLDRFEGFPVYYRKTLLKQDGQEFMVYIMNYPISYPPAPGYVETIRNGYEDWKLNQNYLQQALDQFSPDMLNYYNAGSF